MTDTKTSEHVQYNPFNIGDKVTVNSAGLTAAQRVATRDTTQGKAYTILDTGKDTIPHEDEAISFLDDVGDTVTMNCSAITLAS